MFKIIVTLRHPETLVVLARKGDVITAKQLNRLQHDYGVTMDAVVSM